MQLQIIFKNILKLYDDIKIGVISESIWTEKCDDTHTWVYKHNSE